MFLEETDLDIGVADRTHLFRLLIEVIFTEYALLVGSIVFLHTPGSERRILGFHMCRLDICFGKV